MYLQAVNCNIIISSVLNLISILFLEYTVMLACYRHWMEHNIELHYKQILLFWNKGLHLHVFFCSDLVACQFLRRVLFSSA